MLDECGREAIELTAARRSQTNSRECFNRDWQVCCRNLDVPATLTFVSVSLVSATDLRQNDKQVG